MNLNEKIDEDILNDARNLFIDEGNDENEKNYWDLDLYEDDGYGNESNDNIKPEHAPLQHQEPEITLLKTPIQKESEKPVGKGKIPETVKPPTKQTTEQPPKDNKTKGTVDNKTKSDKCKNDSDCDSNSFCVTKTGKCTAKLDLNQSGCTSNEQCANDLAVCYSKTCMLSCKVGNDAMCKAVEGQGCVEVKDLTMFQGFKGRFNGVCDKVNTAQTINRSVSPKSTMSTSSVVMISGSAVVALTLLTICFIYLRGHLKRRHRNTNPDMFLFNKLQRHASQSMTAMGQRSNSVERLNMRLSNVGGARFTRWAALSSENAGQH